ncbi:MAG: glycosyltransferase, partial [Spirulinaceae cyanobacterium]
MTEPSIQFQAKFQANFHWQNQPIALLITPEFEGIFRNGGIGTYYRTLSQKLKSVGFYVILLLAQSKTAFRGQSRIASLDHIFSTKEWSNVLNISVMERSLLTQYAELDWLEFERYCVLAYVQAIATLWPNTKLYLEFPELLGLATHTIQAKQAGLLNDNCLIAVTLHSGQEWLQEAHGRYHSTSPQWLLQTAQAEQESFEQADLALFLSYFLKEKVQGYGWRTDHAQHLPYCFRILDALPESITVSARGARAAQSIGSSLVFFGRLEERKGLFTFVEAVQQLPQHVIPPEQVVFLGKSEQVLCPGIGIQSTPDYIEQTLGSQYPIHCLTDLFSQEAIALVCQLKNPIVCLTSSQENFPNAAIEMGQLPVRLVVADTGGYRETLGLINRTDEVYWFVPGEVRSLANAIGQALQSEPIDIVVPSSITLTTINNRLLQKRWNHLRDSFGSNTRSTDRSWILGMTSMEEQKFLEAYARDDYSGTGDIVELGCWLGSSTISLAMGLEQNSQVTSKKQCIHAYDLFIWYSQAGMDDNVLGTSLENKYRDGESFLEEYLKRIQLWQELICVHPGDLTTMGCPHDKIEFLFIDAMKSWELANVIQHNFFPHLIAGCSIVLHQDFAHWYTTWIHLLMYRLRDHLTPIKHPFMYSSQAFSLLKPIPTDLLEPNYGFEDFSVSEIEQAFDYSLSFTHPKIQSNILAAKVQCFIEIGNIDRARVEFRQ